MFEGALVYEEDALGTPMPVGVVTPDGLVERFVARADEPAGPVLSAPVAGLLEAVEAVLAQVPAELPGLQALADTAALLSVLERLRGAVLPRLADVEIRKLHVLDGAGSASAWVAQQQTSIDRGDVALSRRLAGLPRLGEAVQGGLLSVEGAQRVGTALARIRRHVDRPDGLIDGLDGEAVVRAVVTDGVADLLLTAPALGGLGDTDPRLAELRQALTAIADGHAAVLAVRPVGSGVRAARDPAGTAPAPVRAAAAH